MQITNEALSEWLKTYSPGRQGLALELGVSKSTIDNWCSNRAIPERSQKTIRKLMEQGNPSNASHVTLPFTVAEYALIMAATAKGNYTDVTDFGRAAVKEKAQSLMTTPPDRRTAETLPFPVKSEVPSRLNEEPIKYGGKK